VHLKERCSDAFLEQCRKMVRGGKDTAINYMSCLMSLTLSNTIKKRLGWAGIVICMDNNTTV
jgi:hypothetical protein